MIEIEHISKTYGQHLALSDVNAVLKNGEITALVGENGAGKSTLMRIICGYIPPSDGKIRINSLDIQKQRLNALTYIGYVPEISILYGEMTVYDFMLWQTKLRNVLDYNNAILKAANNMRIIDILTQKIETLSKGYKKRVEIAAALTYSPQILILDEPTDGLDPNQKYEIRQFIQQYAKDHTVLVSTHVLEDALIADRIIMLAEGKIVNDSSLEEFKKISRHNDLNEAFRILSQPRKEGK